LVEPVTSLGRVFFLTGDFSTTLTLRAYDTRRFTPTGSETITGVSGEASSLIRCGTNLLRFARAAGQVFLVQTSLLPQFLTQTDVSVGGDNKSRLLFVGSDGAAYVRTVNATGQGRRHAGFRPIHRLDARCARHGESRQQNAPVVASHRQRSCLALDVGPVWRL
jgi:hypothetical protein